ncbi:hypothetical protein Misp03_82200 [Microbispora sp. NBRC 16548]|nr:hypothetical protein Misp03_82200 [Microbispora sp. NBRC 16548]
MTAIELRPATAADNEFCFRLHKAAMGDIVAAIWGWDEQDQRDHHTRVFDPGNTRIITADAWTCWRPTTARTPSISDSVWRKWRVTMRATSKSGCDTAADPPRTPRSSPSPTHWATRTRDARTPCRPRPAGR